MPPSAARRFAVPALCAALAAGCASDDIMRSWRASDIAGLGEGTLHLRIGSERVETLDTRSVRTLLDAKKRVEEAAAGPQAELIVTEGAQPNAFVYYDDGRPTIAANLAMLRLIGDDPDACAALVGHELAHLALRHREKRSARAREHENSAGLLGLALSAVGLPFGILLAEAATTVSERGYTRDDEREADELGLFYMRQAGFDPAGAIRLQQKLADAGGTTLLPFLSTHPSGAERIDAMRRLAEGEPAQAPGSARTR